MNKTKTTMSTTMVNAITRVAIKDFLVFKGEFTADFCPGVNVLIGGNASGKTTLMKALYFPYAVGKSSLVDRKWSMSAGEKQNLVNFFGTYTTLIEAGKLEITIDNVTYSPYTSALGDIEKNLNAKSVVYIPEKDILEHARGLLPFIDQKDTGFSNIYRDVLITAQDVHTRKQSEIQKTVGKTIADTIGGEIEWVPGEGMYYTVRTDGTRIPFTNEASGYKKLGYLGLLVASGHLEPGTVLFWDEPENSLNPELVPVLVDILLKLSQNGVQIFLATHSYDIARWLELNKNLNNTLRYFNLRKDGEGIVADVADNYVSLPNSVIEDAGDRLLRRVTEVAAENAGVKLK